jgi:hypothetical protein
MLTLDPVRRITMDNIKIHPAFRTHLPAAYIVPTPIPLVNMSQPINVDDVSDEIKQSLRRLGIGDDEFVSALAEPESNLVRVFVMILTRKVDIVHLPWHRAMTGQVTSTFRLTPEFADGPARICYPKTLPREGRSMRPSSPEQVPGSDPQRPGWALFEKEEMEYDFDHTYGPVHMGLQSLLVMLQGILIQAGFRFFHPSDFQLIGKNERDGYLQMRLSFLSPDAIQWRLQMKNVVDDVQSLCEQVKDMVSESILAEGCQSRMK